MAKGDFLGEFEIYVMLALSHLDPDAYGVTIRQEITRRTGRDIAIGAVYATLSRLEEKGAPRAGVGGFAPARRWSRRQIVTSLGPLLVRRAETSLTTVRSIRMR